MQFHIIGSLMNLSQTKNETETPQLGGGGSKNEP